MSSVEPYTAENVVDREAPSMPQAVNDHNSNNALQNSKSANTSIFSRFTSLMSHLFGVTDKKMEFRLEKPSAGPSHEEINAKEAQRIKDLEYELYKEVTECIKVHNEKKLTLILNKGYEPDLNQYILLLNSEPPFSSPEIKAEIKKALKGKLATGIFDIFNQQLELAEHRSKHFGYKNLFMEEMGKTLKEVGQLALKIWGNSDLRNIIQDDEQAFKAWQSCQHALSVCREQKYLFYNNENFQQALEGIIATIEREKSHVIESHLSQGLEKYDELFNSFESVRKSIITDLVANVSSFRETDLPASCQQLLKKIKLVHGEISADKLTTQQHHEFETLYKKMLPKVLEEYITISPRYKEKLRLFNEDPDALLLDSLQQIYDKISQVADSQQDNLHRDVKVSNRYLRNS